MNSRRFVTAFLMCCAAVFAVAAGCQTYDFEPVAPVSLQQITTKPPRVIAQDTKPNLFFLVDKSGSMDFAIDPSALDGGCAVCASQPVSSESRCTGCQTRWDQLLSSMDSFLASNGSIAHMGMVPYPANNRCAPATLENIADGGVELDQSLTDDSATLKQTADAIRQRLAGIRPAGGTPTAASLRPLRSYSPLYSGGRRSFVVLLTDGLPNCNPALNSDTMTCTCTRPSNQTRCTLQVSTGDEAVQNECLDVDKSVAEIQALRARGLQTIIIGFGSEVANVTGQTTLQAMATAGGFTRSCELDADCGEGDTCSVSTVSPCGVPIRACARRYFQAKDATDLTRALNDIRRSINCAELCTYYLDPMPSDPRLISVTINGQNQVEGPDSWQYIDGGVKFVGAACSALRDTTPETPAQIEFRVIEVR